MLYKEKPEGFIPDVEVVSCLIEYKDEILFLHRVEGKFEGNKWGPPGGKVDKKDENLKQALARELKDETGLAIKEEDLNFYKTFYVIHSNGKFFYHYFNCRLPEKPNITLSENEHNDFKWATVKEALRMPLVIDEDYCLKDFYKIS